MAGLHMDDEEPEWAFPQQATDREQVRERYNYAQFSDEHFRYEVKGYAGYAVIFNNTKFRHPRFSDRVPSQYDVASLKQTLIGSLGFKISDVVVHDDKTTDQMIRILEHVARRDFTHDTCLMVVVLSYGEYQDGEAQSIVRSVDGRVTYQQLLSPFKYGKVPSLVDTPKFFIIQSERPTDDEFGHNFPVPPPLTSSTEITDPDTLFISSVDPQSVVWRRDGKGSWFIQRLCEVLQGDGLRKDITHIYTRMLRLVQLDYESFLCFSINTNILCPRMVSLLSKEFQFRWQH